MKIIFAGQTMNPKWKGGEPIIARDIAKRLKDKGCEVRFIYCPRGRIDKLIRLFNWTDVDPIVYFRWYATFKKHKPDVVLGWYDLDSSMFKAAQDLKIPVIACAQTYWMLCNRMGLWDYRIEDNCKGKDCWHCQVSNYGSPPKFLGNRVNEFSAIQLKNRAKYMNRCDKVIACSNYVKKKLEENDIENVIRIYNGIDLKFWKSTRRAGERNVFYSAAGHEIHKGWDAFCNASKMWGKKYKFYACGEDDGEPNIKFLGYLDRKKMKRTLNKMDIVFCCSAWQEPCGIAFIEAWAMRRKIIHTMNGGLPEIPVRNINEFDIENIAEQYYKVIQSIVK